MKVRGMNSVPHFPHACLPQNTVTLNIAKLVGPVSWFCPLQCHLSGNGGSHFQRPADSWLVI